MILFNSIFYPILSIGGLGLLFGVGLGYAAKKFAVEEDERIPAIRDALPGANCGGCGFAGCDAFASALVTGNAKVNGCPVGGEKVTSSIAEILGVDSTSSDKQVAFVKCNGKTNIAKNNYEYIGISDCRAASMLSGKGSKSCTYGCLGLGSCVNVCMFDAISIVDGIAKVNQDKCTACGKCVSSCPKNLIDLIPEKSTVRVVCNSKDKGKDVKNNCSVGCIGCKLCVKACKYDAISVSDQIAKVDYNKCTLCMECVHKCPVKIIDG